MRIPRIPALFLASFLVSATVLFLAGCADSGAGANPFGPIFSTSVSTTANRSAVESTAPPTTTTVAFTAANGTDFGACQQGNCEVLVHQNDQIALADVVGLTSLTITQLGDDEITVSAVFDDGTQGTTSGATGPFGSFGDGSHTLDLTLVATQGDAGILQLVTH